MLAEALHAGGADFADGWNFGPRADDARRVAWIADRMKAAWGGDADWVVDRGAHPSEAPVLRLDASKAESLLGWQPAVGLDQALDWIVEWYRGRLAGEHPRDLTVAQIDRYERLVRERSPASST